MKTSRKVVMICLLAVLLAGSYVLFFHSGTSKSDKSVNDFTEIIDNYSKDRESVNDFNEIIDNNSKDGESVKDFTEIPDGAPGKNVIVSDLGDIQYTTDLELKAYSANISVYVDKVFIGEPTTVKVYDLSKTGSVLTYSKYIDGNDAYIDNALSGKFFEVTQDSEFKLSIVSDEEETVIPLKAQVEGTYTVVICENQKRDAEQKGEQVLCYFIITDNRYLMTEFDEGYFTGSTPLPESQTAYHIYAITVENS